MRSTGRERKAGQARHEMYFSFSPCCVFSGAVFPFGFSFRSVLRPYNDRPVLTVWGRGKGQFDIPTPLTWPIGPHVAGY